MKKTVLVMIVLSLAIGVPGIAKSNAAEIVVWQIGKIDGEEYPNDPIGGSSEYPVTGEVSFDPFEYRVGSDEDPINAPEFPGYMAPQNVCDIAQDGRPCTDTRVQIEIYFTLDCYEEGDELTLVYGRFGSEADDIYLNGDLLDRVSGIEGKYDKFEFSLENLLPGENQVSIILVPPGGNGHYIDYIQLLSTRECLASVEVDIKPGSCPNPLNLKSKGVLPVALLGTEDFDVSEVDIASLKLAEASPVRSAFEDVATALAPVDGKEDCYLDCNDLGPDGFEDLTLKFDRQEIVGALGDVEDGECVVLQLTGNLMDGTAIEGEDVMLILKKPDKDPIQEKKGKK